MVAVAYFYHFPPRDIWEMPVKELLFWNNGIEWGAQQLKRK